MASNLLIYGARSGIQKAIRRGDPRLAKACFDIIWEEPEHRKWLLWRLPVLVFEDCWPMAGELAKAQKENVKLSAEDSKKAWQRFVILLTVARKNQDAAWLWYLAKHGEKNFDNVEFSLMREIVLAIPGDTPGKLPAFVLQEKLREATSRELTDYEKQACHVIEARRISGGMVSDQWNAISAQALIHLRGLPEEGVLGMIEDQRAVYSKLPIRPVTALPWFCFDMHTRPGQLAMRVWLKNHKTRLLNDEERLGTVWFQLTSAELGGMVLPNYNSIGRGAAHWSETIWQREKEESIAGWLGVSVAEMKKQWQANLTKVQELVEWAIRKNTE
jgi:hypothetical protein